MRKIIILLTVLLTLANCSVREKPVFLRLENIKVLESTSTYLMVSANAVFMNPNDIGGELRSDGIKVYVNDNQMANVSSEAFQVPAKKEFSIPLKANIPLDSLFSDKNLSGLLGSLFNRNIKVQYKGDIKYKALGFTYTYDIDKTESIKIKM